MKKQVLIGLVAVVGLMAYIVTVVYGLEWVINYQADQERFNQEQTVQVVQTNLDGIIDYTI